MNVRTTYNILRIVGVALIALVFVLTLSGLPLTGFIVLLFIAGIDVALVVRGEKTISSAVRDIIPKWLRFLLIAGVITLLWSTGLHADAKHLLTQRFMDYACGFLIGHLLLF
jgi:hypothetical protein